MAYRTTDCWIVEGVVIDEWYYQYLDQYKMYSKNELGLKINY